MADDEDDEAEEMQQEVPLTRTPINADMLRRITLTRSMVPPWAPVGGKALAARVSDSRDSTVPPSRGRTARQRACAEPAPGAVLLAVNPASWMGDFDGVPLLTRQARVSDSRRERERGGAAGAAGALALTLAHIRAGYRQV